MSSANAMGGQNAAGRGVGRGRAFLFFLLLLTFTYPAAAELHHRFTVFLGGSGDDTAAAVLRDASGQIYVAGTTDSTDFPVLGTARTRAGGSDAFVARFTPAGRLLWTLLIGGSGHESAAALAWAPDGTLWLAGSTDSADFPALPSGATLAGTSDAFVCRIDRDGALLDAKLIGGSGEDHAAALAVDALGDLFVAGRTTSAPDSDAFVVRIEPATGVAWWQSLGGSADDEATALCLDASGTLWLAGRTHSSDFPVVAALDRCDNGAGDLFLARFSDDGVLVSSSYVGGSGEEGAPHLSLLPGGAVVLAASTRSLDFPATARNNAGGADCVSLSVDPSMLAMEAAYFGGTGDETVQAVAADAWGLVWIAGGSNSDTLPLAPTQIGMRDAYVTRTGPTGVPLWSTRLGSFADDEAAALTVDALGNLFVTGSTRGGAWPQIAPGSQRHAGGNDVFLVGLRESRVDDLFLLALAWRFTNYQGPLDLDWSGTADPSDFFQLLLDWSR